MDYEQLLLDELVLALGCTEPIAIALAAAGAGQLLPEEPQTIDVHASGSIIKNAYSVHVPHSGGRQGIPISAALGALSKRPDRSLQVLEEITPNILNKAVQMVEEGKVRLHHQENVDNVYIRVDLQGQNHRSSAVVSGRHNRISFKSLDGQILKSLDEELKEQNNAENWNEVTLKGIYQWVNNLCFEERPRLKKLMEQEIQTNLGIAKLGLSQPFGQEVGRTILEISEGDLIKEAIAHAAAGSDARMAGSDAAVTINAGSGNQGITVSVPIIYIAQKLGKSHDLLLRALTFSNLVGLYQKQFIGKLSAYCGAVSAAAACVCGVAYLQNCDYATIQMALSNTLGSVGGLVCDGAKGSCAKKIASALADAFLSLDMAKKGLGFKAGDGVVGANVDETVRNFGRIAYEGMVATDQTILNIMTQYANEQTAN
ncbi:MAG: serine dehydratase subunit alpha family protein [Christensenellales bacterium]